MVKHKPSLGKGIALSATWRDSIYNRVAEQIDNKLNQSRVARAFVVFEHEDGIAEVKSFSPKVQPEQAYTRASQRAPSLAQDTLFA